MCNDKQGEIVYNVININGMRCIRRRKERSQMKGKRFRIMMAAVSAVSLLITSCAPITIPSSERPAQETLTSAAPESIRETSETASVETTQDATEQVTTEQEMHTVRFVSSDGTELSAMQRVELGDRITEPELSEVPGKTFEGWYGEGIAGRWRFDEDTVGGDMTLTAVFTDPVMRMPSALTTYDIGRSAAVLNGTNAGVVIFVQFTDGYVPDREQFENSFRGKYGPGRALDSVSTYFGCNSYGHISFDYYFFYYDSGLSCREAYLLTSDENYGHRLLYDAFDTFRGQYEGDPKDWDKNEDGYVDMLWFVTGEDTLKTVGDGYRRVIYGNASPTAGFDPDRERPAIHCFSKILYESLQEPLRPAMQSGGNRVLLHETGHQLGLEDYYDPMPYKDQDTFDALGMFDMQASNFGDWNSYSRFACGWLDPYVADGSREEMTLKLGCSSEVPDALLIPTASGWNKTAFDEYILIDVMAPYAANGYDWQLLSNEVQTDPDDPRMQGGVRVCHVDGRLIRVSGEKRPVETQEELMEAVRDLRSGKGVQLWPRFWNSNGIDPVLSEDSRFCHMIEIVPSDGSARFRRNEHKMFWQACDSLTVDDLYGPGDTFSMEKCSDAFVFAPLMNNGSSFDYEVSVVFFDPDEREAIVTVRKIR